MFKKQLEALEKFKKLKVGALFMQMGTGKTKVALDLVNYNNVDFCLIVCPFSAKENILKENKKWGINCDFKIVGYETIQASDRIYLNLHKKLERYKRNFIIADESIFIKNEKSKRYERLLAFRKKCEYALILNGTPLTKNEWDLYNQMHFLSPLIINMSRNEFKSNFFTKIIYKKYREKERSFYKFSKINAEYLNELIKPYVFNSDLIFDKKEHTKYIHINYDDEEYDKEKAEALIRFAKNRNPDEIMNLLTRLNYVVSCYEDKNRQVAEYIKNKQVIVYCNFIEEIEQIKEYVKDCFIITGKTKNRTKIINQFRNSNKPLLMTYGVGSYSLNLQFANKIVFSSINFDYGKIEQAKHRIKRIGQQRDIEYTYFITKAGITRLILDNLYKKKNLLSFVNEKMKKGDFEWVKSI